MKFRYLFGWILSLGFLAGCELTPEGKVLFVFMQKQGQDLVAWIQGADPTPSPSPSTSVLPEGEQFLSTAAKNAKANSEILHEMFLVTFMREPKDRSEFGNWVDTLNQGASFEGVYNGFTHSVEYRRLEATYGGASVTALRVFAEELAYLEVELPKPTEFDWVSSSPLPSEKEAPTRVLEIENHPSPLPAPTDTTIPHYKELVELRDRYIRQFVGSSVFTLKRVLSDEALKVVSEKSQYHEKLALWYSKWVMRVLQRNIDFGIPLRNKFDENFHYKWAIENADDRIRWEILNRLHRLINEFDKQRQ